MLGPQGSLHPSLCTFISIVESMVKVPHSRLRKSDDAHSSPSHTCVHVSSVCAHSLDEIDRCMSADYL